MSDLFPKSPNEQPLHAVLARSTARTRLHLLKNAAFTAAKHGDLLHTELEDFLARGDREVLLPGFPGPEIKRPAPAAILEILQKWSLSSREYLNRREEAWFVLQFIRALGWDDDSCDQALLNLREYTTQRRRQRIRWQFRNHAKSAPRQGPLSGIWLPDSRRSLEDLREALRAAVASEAATVLKVSDHGLVVSTELEGRAILIKRVAVAGGWDQFRYRFRISHGRRSYAAARTLLDYRIDTPTPLGFIEETVRGQRASWYISAFEPGVRTVRQWIKPHAHQWPEDDRRKVSGELRDQLIALYECGIYHDDTKAGNLLVHSQENPETRRYQWIDLEGCSFGVRPSRRMVMRNLVQLNGSIGRKIPLADREAFVRSLSPWFPWLAARPIMPKLEKETRKRLRREVLRICSH
jgi:hypothetical protein